MATYNGSWADDDITTEATGNHQVNAGEGNNTVTSASNGNVNVNAGAGNDTITTAGGNDIINAGEGRNVIDAGQGNNVVNSGGGADLITTGSGDDQINAGGGDNEIDAGDGRNRVNTGAGNDRITTGSGDDEIHAGDGQNIIDAGGGNNRITSGSGADVIMTESGNDTVYSGAGSDILDLGGGNDLAYAGEGNDTFIHVVSDNLTSRDDYWAEGGTDTLRLVLNAEQTADAAILADIAGFQASLAKGEWMYQFQSIGLTARQFERLEVYAPVEANDDSITVSEDDGPITINVLANDRDLLVSDNAALTVTDFTVEGGVPEGASLTLNPDGTFSFDPGTAYQHLNENETATLTFTYTIEDDQGFTDTATATISITGKNDPASISGDRTGSVTEDGEIQTVGGKLTVTDVDQGQAMFQPVDPADLDTPYGAFTFDTDGNWTFVLDNDAAQSLSAGETVQQTLTVISADGTATETITVDVAGVDEAPAFAGFDGKWIHYQYYFPSLSNPYAEASNGNYLVGDGVEVVNIINNMGTLDLSGSDIIITLNPAYWSSSDFNGFRISDVGDNLPSFESVTIVSNGMTGFTQSDISWDEDNIWVNWQGDMAPGASTMVRLHVDFLI